ncbi:MAG: histidinol-phosphatase [Pseudonocardiales bacterium]|nr:histidinol-phosphatase [Pseudonocardiales bacterium]
MPVNDLHSSRAEVAVNIVTEAGQIAKRWYENANYRVDAKDDGSPVTQADLEIETFLRAALLEHFPDDAILGEEFGETPGTSGYRWIVDPIDGTKSFVRAVPLYANLIALERDGEVLFGAINLPSAGILVHAEKGGGCWRNGQPTEVSGHDRLEGAYVMATWLEDWRPETIGELTGQGVILRTWGDAYGYAMVASGHADAVVDYTTKAYDLAPMPVIIAEAGGRFTSLDGDPSYDRGSGIASNGLLHDPLLKLVSQAN